MGLRCIMQVEIKFMLPSDLVFSTSNFTLLVKILMWLHVLDYKFLMLDQVLCIWIRNLCLNWWSSIIWMGAAPELTNPLRDHRADCEGKHGLNCSSTTVKNYWREKYDELWVYKLANYRLFVMIFYLNLIIYYTFTILYTLFCRSLEDLLMGKIVGTWSSFASYLSHKFVGIGM